MALWWIFTLISAEGLSRLIPCRLLLIPQHVQPGTERIRVRIHTHVRQMVRGVVDLEIWNQSSAKAPTKSNLGTNGEASELLRSPLPSLDVHKFAFREVNPTSGPFAR
jgi:hypothetical protein